MFFLLANKFSSDRQHHGGRRHSVPPGDLKGKKRIPNSISFQENNMIIESQKRRRQHSEHNIQQIGL
uniref:Uncharacterized protein n=1 Tax=Acrobeloides nanus TaxID=290746 RepID=A0A914DIA2_9BILA